MVHSHFSRLSFACQRHKVVSNSQPFIVTDVDTLCSKRGSWVSTKHTFKIFACNAREGSLQLILAWTQFPLIDNCLHFPIHRALEQL